MEDRERYGELLTPDIKIHRQEFREMLKLLGIRVLYRAPKKDIKKSKWTSYAEFDNAFEPPIMVGCIFHNHPDQRTLKKIGWVSELQEDASIIEVDYDLPNLQVGSIFIVPSGLDNSEGRIFRVIKMTNSIIYPSSITCAIIPEYISTFDDEKAYDYKETDFTLLNQEMDSTAEERLFPGGVAKPDFEKHLLLLKGFQ